MSSFFQNAQQEPAPAVTEPRHDQRAQVQTDTDDERMRTLSSVEKEWKEKIYRRLLDVMDLSLIGNLNEDEARTQIRDICGTLMNDASVPLNLTSRKQIIARIEDEVMGLGPLEPLLADKTVSDILVNGCEKVYVERRGKLKKTNVRFNDERHLLNIIDRIVSGVGRRVDESSPMVDARLSDGSRVNAIIPPLALDGATLSIRRFAVELLGSMDLVNYGSMTEDIGKILDAVVKSRLNILISGGTGAGKTTLLNIVSGFIPEDERIVTIEDSAELQLQQPHVGRLETRPPNIEGTGEVNQRELVRNSLRMRPDRIIVGEVRGGEALDMLQAMNTGHDGSLTTIHANTPRDALARIENMVAMAGVNFPINALRTQIASAINLVVQIQRAEDGVRRIVSIQEINGMEGDVITLSELFSYERRGVDEEGNVEGDFKATGIIPGFMKRVTQRGIDLPVELFNPDATEFWR
ncbi:MAG: CpaF family protein [Gammaproteobacteria bacterium]